MAQKTIITNTSGIVRKFSYLPPNGRTLGIGESFIVNGVLDTILSLGKTSRYSAEFDADQASGDVSVLYPVEVDGIVYPTANYTLTAADAGRVFNNKDASGTVTLTLPTPVPLSFQAVGFVVGIPFVLSVKAAVGNFIRYGDIVGPSGGEMNSSAVGAQVWIRPFSSNTWIVDRIMGGEGGSWTDPA